jgi:aminopeptidase N
MDALKRSMRWDEEAFGREYDLDVFNIVAVSDFNMGAMENKGLNVFNDKYVLASRDGDRCRLRGHRGDHRARIFPQLDRQPHHLPRLVPALPQGRADGLPRPGILRRQRSRAVKRIADVRHAASRAVPEDAGPLAHPVRPDVYREINNFYTATVYEKGSESSA